MFKYKCIVCEQELKPISPVIQDDEYHVSAIEGGHINLSFGYGSSYDDLSRFGFDENVEQWSCICDSCFRIKAKAGIIRTIRVTKTCKITDVSNLVG